jgi:type II secretory ATPase GspE/PulE/Tfp pilus assembly ATPase PilB-like protein
MRAQADYVIGSDVRGRKQAESEENTEPSAVFHEQEGDTGSIVLDELLKEALRTGASSIHIEETGIRFRICGRLRKVKELRNVQASGIIQKIKQLAYIDISEKQYVPESSFVYNAGKLLHIRVSCMRALYASGSAESVVLHLFDQSCIPFSLGQLGMDGLQVQKLSVMCRENSGLILIGGTACSGKSTTAAALLLHIQHENSNRKKIVNLENPPEYILPGIIQIQSGGNEKWCSPETLYHVLRQYPDVIMAGDITDGERAAAAVHAAAAGCLVLAVLNSAGTAEAVMRMLAFGISPAVLAVVLKGIVIQQIVYREEHAVLLADVAAVRDKFQETIINSYTAEDLNNCFSHCTNVVSQVSKSIKRLASPVYTGLRESADTEKICV